MLEKLKALMNHERYQLITVVVVLGFVVWLQGCPSQVPSLIDESRRVTRVEYQAEIDLFLARAAVGAESLDKQDALKAALAQNAVLFTTTGTINPVGLVTTVFGILGLGATVDNIRRRKEEKKVTKSATS